MDQWQKLEDGSYICHILALMETSHIDNTFYFDEAQQQWTESDDLGVSTQDAYTININPT
uniref:Uncharacterized protein n=1 Tax=Physcomitrium patens TaxID=3218 RepID=A0A2K1JUN4_PHYPA|nr:hypothetical protein PHYPA_015012 [Physcomitrium patens]